MLPLKCPTSLSTWYTTAMFEVPHPQVLRRTPIASMVENFLHSNGKSKSDHTFHELMLPLPPTKQHAGYSMGFF